MVALELECLAAKFDRFGWERNRNTPAHDRLILDWMDALQDYPLAEIRDACKAQVLDNPKWMPNEGAIVAKILAARKIAVAAHKARLPKPEGREFSSTDPEAVADRAAFAAGVLRQFPSNRGDAA